MPNLGEAHWGALASQSTQVPLSLALAKSASYEDVLELATMKDPEDVRSAGG